MTVQVTVTDSNRSSVGSRNSQSISQILFIWHLSHILNAIQSALQFDWKMKTNKKDPEDKKNGDQCTLRNKI